MGPKWHRNMLPHSKDKGHLDYYTARIIKANAIGAMIGMGFGLVALIVGLIYASVY